MGMLDADILERWEFNMIFQYDIRKRPFPVKFYLANPNHKIIRTLSGITKARLKPSLLDIWEIDFEVDKYLINDIGKQFINPLYDKLTLLMEIKVDNLGWFRIDRIPEERQSGERIYKSFTAFGYETTLNDIDIVGININTGTEDSVEMYDENLDVLGIPKHNIQLYIKNESDDPTSDSYWKLGLLNILEHEYLRKKGWRIGEIDIAVAPLRGRQFEIDNQSVYSFLTQDAASAYKCLFWFDRINKTVNAIKLENLGSSMNLELTFRNVVNDIEIKDKNDKYYTRFRVAGNDADSSLIEHINYGSDKLINIDYCIDTGKVSKETADKYVAYKEFVESHREEYAEYSRTFMKLNEERTVYYEQTTIDEISVMYTNLSDDELQLELTHAETLRDTLLEVYGTEDSMKSSPDYQIYMSYKDVIIPKIQAEIEARKSGTHAPSDEVDYETNWELYGINILKMKLDSFNAQIEILKNNHYDQEWSEEIGGDKSYHNKQHQIYLDYQQYIIDITARLNELQEKVDAIDVQIQENNSKQQDLAAKAQLEHYSWGFTDNELSDIYSLFRDTDYTDSAIEILETDTIDDVIDLAWQLYDSAKEQIEIESHPQLVYSISLDNLFHIPQFAEKINNMSLGDFCYLELEDGFKTKQRLIGMELELVNFNDTSLSVEFSDMTTVCGKADDYRFILESGTSSQKNSISRSTQTYVNNTANTVAEKVIAKYFNSTGSSVFPSQISQSDIQKLKDALDGLISGVLSLDELKAKLAKIDTLEANSAFVKYLETQYLVGNQADFKELRAKVGLIDDLLAGTVSAELGHLIHLTAQNVSIDEAVIKQLIASRILVSDLRAGDITINNNMRILSEDGMMIMNGRTFQILGTDKNGNQYVAIQLGYDAENKPSLIIRDENGIVMLDGSGLHENIVPDGLIVTNMIHDGAITEDKIDKTNIHEWTDSDGNKVFDVSNMYYGNDKFSVSYNSIKSDVSGLSTSLSGVEKKVDANTKSITNEIWKSSIIKTTDADGNEVSTSIEDLLINHTTDLNGIHSEVSNVKTSISSSVQTLEEKIADFKVDFNGFKTTVSNTYTTKDELGQSVSNITSQYTQLADKFNWVVKSGTSASDFTITDRMISLTSSALNIDALTTFKNSAENGTSTVINGGAIKSNTITAEKLVIGDFMNYADLTTDTASKYGFAVVQDSSESNNPWLQLKTLNRDTAICPNGYTNYKCNGGETFRIKFQVSSTVQGTYGIDSSETKKYLYVNVGLYGKTKTGSTSWIVPTGGLSDADGTVRTVNVYVALPSNLRTFSVYLQLNGYNFTGTCKVRNISVTKMMSGELIVNGAITTDKLSANVITTAKLATDAIKSTNYSYSSGNFSYAGTFLDLSTGLVRSKNFAIDSSGNAYFKGNIQANAGYIGGTSGWAITTNTITGNANSKIVSGILESSNYVENSTGVQVNLNTGIIKGNIEASTLAAKEAIKIYVGSTKRNVITGHLESDFFYVRIGCDLSTSNIARVKPSIILNKSTASTNVSDMITINTEALDIYANTTISGSLVANDLLTNGVINTSGNDVYCNDIMTRTGWTADRLSHGETAYSNLMSGRISFKWAQNSSGVWKIYVYVDGTLVRDW